MKGWRWNSTGGWKFAPTLREMEHVIATHIADTLSAEDSTTVEGPDEKLYKIDVTVTLTPHS